MPVNRVNWFLTIRLPTLLQTLATASTIRCGKLNKNNKNQDTTIMKAKYVWVALLALTFFGCDDNTGTRIGNASGKRPKYQWKIHHLRVDYKFRFIRSCFAKTSVGYVGKFTDKEFGDYEASFLAQLNSRTGFPFPRFTIRKPIPKVLWQETLSTLLN